MKSNNGNNIISHSREVTEIPSAQDILHQDNFELTKTLASTGSPIVFLFLLCWFFKILTRFIEVCKEN
jgi:hypothetical protein